MERERWVKLDSVLQSALDRPAEERDEFLKTACSGDDALLKDAQAMLNSTQDVDGFLEAPALNVAAQELAAQKRSLVGANFGPYRVLKSIGAGGMGEVFLALDTRLDRQIALKTLPAEFAADPVRVHRFEVEARAASALNHPNVLVVHDIGVQDGLPFIASEYLEGKSLRERLAEGPLPANRAIDFAIQTARALAAAHDKGIFHRDLKPENIFVTPGNQIKILDFGLAKLTQVNGKPQKVTPITQVGMVMGTPGYLAPEQLRGQEAGAATDIFSFGCVLYEMLAGRRAFLKDTNAETIAAVMKEEAPAIEPGQGVTAEMVRVVNHCLEKTPADRFQSSRDLIFALEGCAVPVQRVLPEKPRTPYWRWIAAGVLAAAMLAFLATVFTRKPAVSSVARFEVAIPGEPVTGSPAISISPDGKYLAFLAMGPQGRPVLYLRGLDELVPTQVANSEDATYPFWSPDSKSLAFHVGEKLKSVDVASGGQRTLCTIRGTVNGAWSAENVILLSRGSGPLVRLQPDGEHLVPVTKVDSATGQRGHWWPSFLPDSQHFIYTVNASSAEHSGVYVGSLKGGDGTKLVSGLITNAMYVSPGYLLYVRDRNLLARLFDAKALNFTGEEFPLVEKLRAYYGYTAYSASQTGTLIYRAGDLGRFKLAWFDRTGKQIGSAWKDGVLPLMPALSPDGTHLAIVQYQSTEAGYGIWVNDLKSNIEYPVTVIRNAEYPVWSPDGARLAFSASLNGGARDLMTKRWNDSGPGKPIFHTGNDKWPLDWSSDGKTLLFYMNNEQGQAELWATSFVENSLSQVPGTPLDVSDARLSPDGKWLAYTSNQSGASIIFMQDFPKGESRLPISERGASNPRWNHDGTELFYLSPRNELVSVHLRYGASVTADAPQVLFKTLSVGVNPYTVSADGQRFLFQIPADTARVPTINLVQNWPATLPGKR